MTIQSVGTMETNNCSTSNSYAQSFINPLRLWSVSKHFEQATFRNTCKQLIYKDFIIWRLFFNQFVERFVISALALRLNNLITELSTDIVDKKFSLRQIKPCRQQGHNLYHFVIRIIAAGLQYLPVILLHWTRQYRGIHVLCPNENTM